MNGFRSAVVVGAGFLVAACAGGQPTVSGFASQATKAADAYVTEAQALSSSYQRVLEIRVANIIANAGESAVDEATELVRVETVEFLSLLSDALDRYTAEFTGIVTPAAVAEERDTYVSVLTGAAGALPEMRDAVVVSGTIDDIQRSLVASAYADAQIRLVASCEALEQAVRDEGHGVDLKCAPTEVVPSGTEP